MSHSVNIPTAVSDYLIKIKPQKKKREYEKIEKYLRTDSFIALGRVSEEDKDYIRSEAIEVVRKIKTKPENCEMIFNDFFAYLEKLDSHFALQKLNKLLTPLERRLSICGKLHANMSRQIDIEELAREYMVSVDTISEDICALRNGITIFNRNFSLPYKMYNSRITIPNTAHPLLLTPNLVQIICMLEGLRTQSLMPERKTNCVKMAAEIWSQLSDYAKDRILNAACEALRLDHDWYEKLDAITGNASGSASGNGSGNGSRNAIGNVSGNTSGSASGNGSGNAFESLNIFTDPTESDEPINFSLLIDCAKCGTPIEITYYDDNDFCERSIKLTGVGIGPDGIEYCEDDMVYEIPFESIKNIQKTQIR